MTDAAATFLEEYRTAALAAGRLQAEAEHAEELRKQALSKGLIECKDTSVSKAEHLARISADYTAAMNALHAAKVAAAEARAQLDYLNKRWEKWRTQMASERVKQSMKGDPRAVD